MSPGSHPHDYEIVHVEPSPQFFGTLLTTYFLNQTVCVEVEKAFKTSTTQASATDNRRFAVLAVNAASSDLELIQSIVKAATRSSASLLENHSVIPYPIVERWMLKAASGFRALNGLE